MSGPSAIPEIVVRGDRGRALAVPVDPKWICPVCAGRGGLVVKQDNGYEAITPCDCRYVNRRIELFNAAEVGARYAGATLDTFVENHPTQGQALAAARRFAKEFPRVERGLLFWGTVGTGKTHLAVGMLREVTLRKGFSARIVEYPQLLEDLRRAYAESTGVGPLMRSLAQVDVLVLDELANGLNSDWETTVIDDLVSRRYNAGRTTICTTNFEPGDTQRREYRGPNPDWGRRESLSARGGPRETLLERVGERVFSRIRAMCEFHQVIGPDHRNPNRVGPGGPR
jgi:DNA replication protein DnaC